MSPDKKRRAVRTAVAITVIIALCLAAVLYRGAGQSLTVLMYHHIAPVGELYTSETVSIGKIRQDLQWLSDNGWKTVLPSELLSGKAEIDDKTVLITFDDGYRSNYEYLYPLLKEYGMKAEIAVITSFIDAEAGSFMTWEMMREMADSGLVEFGSHTHNMHNPDTAGIFVEGGANGVQKGRDESAEEHEAKVREDLETSKGRLLEELGKEPVCFAYPFGAHDRVTDRVVDSLFPVSFLTSGRSLFGGFRGFLDNSRGLKRLRRINVLETTPLSELLGE
ncbi:MAG: polysaccharide deacetylase family protein [Firmicutes bacterium]|nr:polysaccharide deacetylase family protein [Bacillota bacterium]